MSPRFLELTTVRGLNYNHLYYKQRKQLGFRSRHFTQTKEHNKTKSGP